MRKYYIDNIRSMIILLLFPVHTFMIWNNFGNKFYIWEEGNTLISTLITIVNPWLMPILFAFAGLSFHYASQKRDDNLFIKERIKKLMIPFLCGLLILVPIQTLYARKFFFLYTGSFFDNIGYFFTHISDLSGYDGAFTPGHLWFLLFLFIISLLFLILKRCVPYHKVEAKIAHMHIITIIALWIPISLIFYIGNFGGFSIGSSFAFYTLGYYLLSNDSLIQTLEKNVRWLLLLFLVSSAILVVLYYNISYYGNILVYFVAWIGVLVIMTAGKRYSNKKNMITEYIRKASFPIYIFHQSILVMLAYVTLQLTDILIWQVMIIMLGSLILTILCYECVRRIPFICMLFGMKYKKMR